MGHKCYIVALAGLLALVAVTSSPTKGQDPSTGDKAAPPNGGAAESQTPPQPAPPVVPAPFNSPQATVFTYLELINQEEKTDEDWRTIITCLDLSKVNAERGRDLAINLYGVLSRMRHIERRDLPDAEQIKSTPITIFNLFPIIDSSKKVIKTRSRGRIDLAIVAQGEHQGYWKFSADTVANINELFRNMEHLPQVAGELNETDLSFSMRLRRSMPGALKGKENEALGLEYWQWLVLLLIIFVGLVVDQIARLILRALIKRMVKSQRARADSQTVNGVVRPVGLVAAALLWLWLTHLLGLPDIAYTILIAAVRVFTALAITWAAWRLTDLACEIIASKAALTTTKFDDVLVPLVRKTLKIFIAAFGLVFVANSLTINVWPLLTGLGIGSLAFAFAARDTIENFFGSISVILDRPFEIGDWVLIGDVEGTVEAVGFRSTRIRTFYNSQVTLPNANLVRATVDNYGRRKYRRWKTHIGVQYDTTPDQLIALTEGIRELVRCHPYTRKDYFQVWVHQFSASSIDILLYIFHDVTDWSMELRERERLMLDIVRLADQLGVQFAFPTQTLHIHQEEHNKPHTVQHGVPESMTDRRAAVGGIRQAQQIVANQHWQKQKPGPVRYPDGPTQIDPENDEQTAIENRSDGA